MVKSDFGYTCGKCLQIQWQIVYKMVYMDGAARCKWWARVLERAYLHEARCVDLALQISKERVLKVVCIHVYQSVTEGHVGIND